MREKKLIMIGYNEPNIMCLVLLKLFLKKSTTKISHKRLKRKQL